MECCKSSTNVEADHHAAMFNMFLCSYIHGALLLPATTGEGMPLGVDKKAEALLSHVHWQACGSRSGGIGSVAYPPGTSPAAGSESPVRALDIFCPTLS